MQTDTRQDAAITEFFKSHDLIVPDRTGRQFSVWYQTSHGKVFRLEYTDRGPFSFVEVNFPEALA